MSFFFFNIVGNFYHPTTSGTSDRSRWNLFSPFSLLSCEKNLSREQEVSPTTKPSIIKHKKINYHNKTTWRWASLCYLSFFRARRRNRLTLVPRSFLFSFSFSLNSTYGYHVGVRSEEELILWSWILIFIFQFCLFHFVHWLRKSRFRERKRREKLSDIMFVASASSSANRMSDDVIELCHENSWSFNHMSFGLHWILLRSLTAMILLPSTEQPQSNVIDPRELVFVLMQFASPNMWLFSFHQHEQKIRSRKYLICLILFSSSFSPPAAPMKYFWPLLLHLLHLFGIKDKFLRN